MAEHPVDRFDFVFPLSPPGDVDGEVVQVKRNGQHLEAVTDVTVRVGVGKLTNVVIGYEAAAKVKAIAMHIASIRLDDVVTEEVLENIYDQAIQEAIGRDAPGAVIVRRIVEMLAERL